MDHDTQAVVTSEFRGDDFVFQQVHHLIGSAVVAEYMKNRVQKTIIGRHQSLIRRMKYVLQYRNNWRITILMSMN